MTTALAADDPDPPRFATGGIVPAGTLPVTLGCCDGYVISRDAMPTVAYPAGNVSVTLDSDPEVSRRAALEIVARMWPERTTAWVDKPKAVEA